MFSGVLLLRFAIQTIASTLATSWERARKQPLLPIARQPDVENSEAIPDNQHRLVRSQDSGDNLRDERSLIPASIQIRRIPALLVNSGQRFAKVVFVPEDAEFSGDNYEPVDAFDIPNYHDFVGSRQWFKGRRFGHY